VVTEKTLKSRYVGGYNQREELRAAAAICLVAASAESDSVGEPSKVGERTARLEYFTHG